MTVDHGEAVGYEQYCIDHLRDHLARSPAETSGVGRDVLVVLDAQSVLSTADARIVRLHHEKLGVGGRMVGGDLPLLYPEVSAVFGHRPAALEVLLARYGRAGVVFGPPTPPAERLVDLRRPPPSRPGCC